MPERILLHIRCVTIENEVEYLHERVPPHRIVVEYIKTKLQLQGNIFYKSENIDGCKKSFNALGIRTGDEVVIKNYVKPQQNDTDLFATAQQPQHEVAESQGYFEDTEEQNAESVFSPKVFIQTLTPQLSSDSGGSNSDAGIIDQESTSASIGALCTSAELTGTPMNPYTHPDAAQKMPLQNHSPTTINKMRRQSQYTQQSIKRNCNHSSYAYNGRKKLPLQPPKNCDENEQQNDKPQFGWRAPTYLHLPDVAVVQNTAAPRLLPQNTAAPLPPLSNTTLPLLPPLHNTTAPRHAPPPNLVPQPPSEPRQAKPRLIKRSQSFTSSGRTYTGITEPAKLPKIPEKKHGRSQSISLDLRRSGASEYLSGQRQSSKLQQPQTKNSKEPRHQRKSSWSNLT